VKESWWNTERIYRTTLNRKWCRFLKSKQMR